MAGLRRNHSVCDDAVYKGDPESSRDAKGALSGLITEPYRETCETGPAALGGGWRPLCPLNPQQSRGSWITIQRKSQRDAACQGSITSTPVGAKSATLRVTTDNPWTRAVAAMSESRTGRGSGT